eukprot:IDg16803t1
MDGSAPTGKGGNDGLVMVEKYHHPFLININTGYHRIPLRRRKRDTNDRIHGTNRRNRKHDRREKLTTSPRPDIKRLFDNNAINSNINTRAPLYAAPYEFSAKCSLTLYKDVASIEKSRQACAYY